MLGRQAPHDANCVGEFDATTNGFSCVDISSVTSISGKFQGAASAISGEIIFAPYQADCVGVYSLPATTGSSATFACVDISQITSANAKFSGAAALSNGKVAFAPFSVTCANFSKRLCCQLCCGPKP